VATRSTPDLHDALPICNRVNSLAFNRDGSHLISAGTDKTAILWDMTTRQAIGLPLSGHQDWIQHIELSPDGATVASQSRDNVARSEEHTSELQSPAPSV